MARANRPSAPAPLFNGIDAAALERRLPATGFAGSDAELKVLLQRLADLSADEVHLIPTTDDRDEVARIADLAG